MSNFDYPKIEADVLSFWKSSKTFEQSNDCREGVDFVFYDGPPFATGTPHYGHILVSVIKDIIARYQNMKGRPVPRKFGWDCHGLPIESLAQKKMNISSAKIIKENKVEEFNNVCRSLIATHTEQWEDTISKIGRWVDFKKSYRTMDNSYMESVWWVFKQIYDQGRIYKAHRIMPYSGQLMTSLSNFEVSDNYREIEDHFVIVQFSASYQDKHLNIITYTTTPWTLPSNVALCVHPEHNYSVVLDKDTNKRYLVGSNLIDKHFLHKNVEVIETRVGKHYEGLTYSPIWKFTEAGYFHKIVCDKFVSDKEGTGIVHIAPAFGEDDYRIGKLFSLPMIDLLDDECKFKSSFFLVQGLFCKDADLKIIELIQTTKSIFSVGKVKHKYPFCERTNSPIIYRAIDAWYVKIEDLQEKLLANNAQINWVPKHIGQNRFANWLKNSKDWNISRNRLWGSCIPIWIAEDGEQVCIGSIEELEKLSNQKITDLHKEHMDKISFVKDGKVFKRIPEVLDCWFESGAMPYAQHHYPFENKKLFEKTFPADFVVEGLDQTRGWFYTLLVLSTILFDKPPFKNVIVNGMILAEDGSKMSKSKENYEAPEKIIEKYGADALRMYLCSSSATHGEPLSFKEKGIEEAIKTIINPFMNAIDFYETYSKSYEKEIREYSNVRDLDHWIVIRLNNLAFELSNDLDNYEIYKCSVKISSFLDDLCNWYIRLSRKVFSSTTDLATKTCAIDNLYYVLKTLCQILAPFIPFTSEHIYLRLVNSDVKRSVHCSDYPKTIGLSNDTMLSEMKTLQKITNIGHRLRKKLNLKVRQPLSNITIFGFKPDELDDAEDIIKNELNIQNVQFLETQSLTHKVSCKPNFKTIGKKFGKDTKAIVDQINNLTPERILNLKESFSENKINYCLIGTFSLNKEDLVFEEEINLDIPYISEDGLIIAINPTLNFELIELGIISEFKSIIQNTRKNNKLTVDNYIFLEVFCEAKLANKLSKYRDHLKFNLKATDIQFFPMEEVNKLNAHEFNINDENLYVNIYKEI